MKHLSPSPMAPPNGNRFGEHHPWMAALPSENQVLQRMYHHLAAHQPSLPQPIATSFAIRRVARCKIRERNNIDSCDLSTLRCQIQCSARYNVRCLYSLKFHFYFLIRQHCAGRRGGGGQYSGFWGAREPADVSTPGPFSCGKQDFKELPQSLSNLSLVMVHWSRQDKFYHHFKERETGVRRGWALPKVTSRWGLGWIPDLWAATQVFFPWSPRLLCQSV